MKLSNKIFVVFTVLVLAVCFVFSVISPTDINAYENRKAEKMSFPTFTKFLTGEFQNDVEAAAGDQLPLSAKLKKGYNLANSYFTVKFSAFFAKNRPNKYVKYKDINLFGPNRLVYSPKNLEDIKENLDAKAENLNSIFKSIPETDFYAYFIEKDTDINFETGKKQGLKEYVFDKLQLNDDRKISFDINGIEEFKNYFYSTDHHWNHKGSYKAYCQIIGALKPSDTPVKPLKEILVSENFSGSKNTDFGHNFFSESFYAYEFEHKNMSVLINGEKAEDYGNQAAFISGIKKKISYSGFYGNDYGEIIFDTGDSDNQNILIVGESFDNAVLKLIASHFNKTCSIDLRYYQNAMKKPFDIKSYIQEHQIDKVLLMGNVNYFSSADFILE